MTAPDCVVLSFLFFQRYGKIEKRQIADLRLFCGTGNTGGTQMFFDWKNIKVSTYLLILLTICMVAGIVYEHRDLL